MKKIIGVVIIALFLPVIAQGEDGNFTGYPDGQYIMIELVGAYKKVYRTMSDLKLKLI